LCIRLGYGEPVVEPHMFTNEGEPLPRNAVIVFSRFTSKTMRRYLDRVKDLELNAPALDAYSGYYNGVELLVTRVCAGAPASILVLEILVAGGVRRVAVLGYAGSLNPRLRIADILLPTWGVREEGTSYHYYPPDYIPRPSIGLTNRLYKTIKMIKGRRRFRVLRGGIWSIDAIFRETRDKVLEYSGRGVLGVDMESTALMCVSEYRGIELALALVVTDELYHEKWVSILDSEKLLRRIRRNEKLLIKATLETITRD